MSKKVLVVDDDPSFRRVIEYSLNEEGYEVTLAGNGDEAMSALAEGDVAVMLTDMIMPGMGGLELLERVQETAPEVPVVVVTAHAAVEDAVKAMREGAFDYVAKPVDREELKLVVRKALEFRGLKDENRLLRQAVTERFRLKDMIGASGRIQTVFQVAAQAARVDSTVLVLGESGTGKELLAKAIHYNSPRRRQPFMVVNCGAIPEMLLESELFGHARGSFTGAIADRKGKIELARGGTVFLDEVGDLKPETQVKLLRLLQEKEVDKVGVPRPIKVDVRIVAATHRQLPEMVQEGTFREDLYYRLSVIPIEVPPLRERREDIPLLADLLLKRYADRFGKSLEMDGAVFDVLDAHDWPGNIRELENLMERLAALHPGGLISRGDLPDSVRSRAGSPNPAVINLPRDGVDLEQVERDIVREALERNGWNQSAAARFLRTSRNTISYRMQKYGLVPPGPPNKPES